MRSLNAKRIRGIVLLCIALFVAWVIVSYFKLIDAFILPSPFKVAESAFVMLKSGELSSNIYITLKRFILGLFLGSFFALLVGFCCGVSKRISSIVEPIIYLTFPIPRFVILPFIVFIFGVGIAPKILFIGLGVFFPIAINTISGINHISDTYFEVAKHYGAKGWRFYKRIILPGCLPEVFSGLRIGVGLALSYTIIAEFLTASDGIGGMMWLSLQTLRMDKLFLSTIIIAVFNVIIFTLIASAENYFVFWNKNE